MTHYARRGVGLVRRLWRPIGGAMARRALGRPPAFPKIIFSLPPTAPRAPDGQSLAYVELSRSLWQASWSEHPGRLRTRIGRLVHDTVQRAHVLERRLLEMTKDGA
jgi:hypothetical protein